MPQAGLFFHLCMHIHMKDFTETLINAAVDASEAILDVREEGYEVHQKEDQSPVTDADYASDKIIRSHLAVHGLPIMSEEVEITWNERRSWDQFWCVDPLDGTREFTAGRDEFTVNIAFMTKGEADQGVIAFPMMRHIYFTHRDQVRRSTWQRGERAEEVLSRAMPCRGIRNQRPFVATVSRMHLNDATAAYLDALREGEPDLEIDRSGSAFKFCKLLDGEANIYPRFSPCMEWDSAAGHALIKRIGMDIFRVDDGRVLRYNKSDLTNPNFIVRQR